MGKLSRMKGASFEREIAKALRFVFPNALRHLEFQVDNAIGIDIDNTGVYKIQCKRGRKYASLSAIEEVTCDEMFGDIPVLVTKGDNKRILVALPFEAFMDLLLRKYKDEIEEDKAKEEEKKLSEPQMPAKSQNRAPKARKAVYRR